MTALTTQHRRIQKFKSFLAPIGLAPIALAFLTFVVGSLAQAGQELLVRKPVQVYSQPRPNSEVIATLEHGERVPISPNDYGRYKKILVQAGGKERPGYVLKAQLEGSRIREKAETRQRGHKAYHHRYGLGIPITLSYSRQGDQKIVSEGYNYEMSSLAGTSTFFGFSFDIPFKGSWALRAELIFRKADHTGSIKPVGAVNKQDVQRSITFVGGGATLKYYFDENGDFWVGAGAEISKASDVTLIYANRDTIAVNQADYPTYMIAKAGLGQDLNLFSDVYLIPEFKVITAINTTPMVYGADLTLTVSYGF